MNASHQQLQQGKGSVKERERERECDCPVCYDFLYNPHISTSCGHTICKACQTKLKNQVCPLCQKVVSNWVTNYAMKDVIYRIYPDEYKRKEAQFQAQTPDGIMKRLQTTYPDMTITYHPEAAFGPVEKAAVLSAAEKVVLGELSSAEDVIKALSVDEKKVSHKDLVYYKTGGAHSYFITRDNRSANRMHISNMGGYNFIFVIYTKHFLTAKPFGKRKRTDVQQ